MRSVLLSVVIIWTLCVNTSAQNMSAGLMAYYPFTASFADQSGNGNNAIARNGATFTTDRWGNANSAAYFDGINDWIYIGASPSMTTSSASTIAFRLKPQRDTVAILMSKADTTGSGGVQNIQYQVGMNLPVGSGYPKGFFYNTMHDGSCATATQGNVTTTVTPVDTGQWYCVIITFNNGVKRTYVNGVLMSQVTVTGTSFNTKIDSCVLGPIKLGFWWTGDPAYYKGTMDEVRFYNRELSLVEMDSLCYYPDTNVFITQAFTDTVKCVNDTLRVNYDVTKNFGSGNIFTVQLSNASGSFASPVNIGSATASAGGILNCVIPGGTPTGTGYKIRIISTSPVNISRDIPLTLDIYNTIPANISATTNASVCNGDTLKLFGNTTSPGVSYSWTGPLSYTSVQKDPLIPNAGVNRSGDYILTARLSACFSKDTVAVLVKPLPATPTAGSNSPVCPNTPLNLTASSSTSGVTYSWAGPSSFSSSNQNPVIPAVTSANAGVYSVTTTLNGCTSSAANTTVLVQITVPKPVATGNSPVCIGGALNLNVGTIAGATYGWTGPNAFTSLNQNPSIVNVTANDAGLYIVTATLNGCVSEPDTVSIAVNPGPEVNIYPSPNDSICTGKSVTLIALPVNGGTSPGYKWMINNIIIPGASGVSYTALSVSNGDVFKCIVTNFSSCGAPVSDTSNPLTITVLPYLAPVVTITSNPSTPLSPWQLITFTATATNCGMNPTYQWKRNGQDVVGATSFTWGTQQVSDNDTISVVVKSSYMCPQPDSAESNKITVSVLTSVNNVIDADKIYVYPNPVTNELVIRGTEKGISIRLYDVIGRMMISQTAEDQTEILNTSTLAPGNYILKLMENGNSRYFKIVKE